MDELKEKVDAVLKSLDELKDLNDTLIDQVAELNLLIAGDKSKNSYLKLLADFNKALLEDISLKDLIATEEEL